MFVAVGVSLGQGNKRRPGLKWPGPQNLSPGSSLPQGERRGPSVGLLQQAGGRCLVLVPEAWPPSAGDVPPGSGLEETHSPWHPRKALGCSRPGSFRGSGLRSSAGCKPNRESRSACGQQPPGEFPGSPEPGLPSFPSLLHSQLPLPLQHHLKAVITFF